MHASLLSTYGILRQILGMYYKIIAVNIDYHIYAVLQFILFIENELHFLLHGAPIPYFFF